MSQDSSHGQRALLVYGWVQDCGGDWGGGLGAICEQRLSIPLGKHATVFQAEAYAILACFFETETQDRPEKYVSICSDSQAALKALQAAKKSLLWCNSANRRSMISPPGILWGYFGSQVMLE
jgi:hypothetical protein